MKTTLSALEEANEASTTEGEKAPESEAPEAKAAPADIPPETEGEEKEPMIAKDTLNVGMEVIEEGEEENGDEEKAKSK